MVTGDEEDAETGRKEGEEEVESLGAKDLTETRISAEETSITRPGEG